MEDDSICKICMDAPVNLFYLQLCYKLYLKTFLAGLVIMKPKLGS